MKNIYQKPNFKFVALNMNANQSACHYKATYNWEVCGVEVIPGFATVFVDEDICSYGPDDAFPVCQHNGGANNSVFGS